MSAATSKHPLTSTEELRGLFVIGLIAVIATVRYAVGNSYNVPFGNTSVDIVPVLNGILFTWSAYAFLVVLGLSISRWREVVLGYARLLLYLGLIFTVGAMYLYFLVGYAPYSLYFSGLIVAYALLSLPRYLISIFKKPSQFKIKPTIEGTAGLILGITLILQIVFALAKSTYLNSALPTTFVGLIAIVVIGLVRFRRYMSGRNAGPKLSAKRKAEPRINV